MSLSVKLIFKANEQRRRAEDVEMRRFSIDENMVTNYDYLRAKVTSVMPRLANKAFRLYWKGKSKSNIM